VTSRSLGRAMVKLPNFNPDRVGAPPRLPPRRRVRTAPPRGRRAFQAPRAREGRHSPARSATQRTMFLVFLASTLAALVLAAVVHADGKTGPRSTGRSNAWPPSCSFAWSPAGPGPRGA
jgi:hypothetical protein